MKVKNKEIFELKKKIEKAIHNNPYCNGNKMLKNRVFHRVEDDHLEILASLNSKTKKPHYWGHIYQKDGVYISCIIAINYWMNPFTVSSLFEEYWGCLKETGKWYPIGGESFEISKNYDTDDNFDYRVVMMYPFPKVFED